jgi:sugar (glycoside-pentoside-hexuronide) transporter
LTAAQRAIGASAQEDPRLTFGRKAVFGTGDFTVNTVLASLSMIYTLYFLTQYAELRPALAGLIPLIGRIVDAFADPLMGRLSDHTRWRAGRRRPYFLLGAVPFGLSFAVLWAPAPVETQEARFAWYTLWYLLHSLAMSMLSVPYLALIPEMARSYDGRTSLNVFRNTGAILGIFAAISIRPIARAFGGGEATAESYALTGVLYGVLVALPWLAVHAVTWERPEFQSRESELSLREGVRALVRHKAYMQLMGFYLASRIAMDLVGTVLILYFTHCLGRSGDFEITMALFLAVVVLSLPFWLSVSRRMEKSTAFVLGALWWGIGNLAFFFAEPDWPRWLVICFAPLVAIGYCAADLMPWSMVGDVVDEDDLATGERREGLYNGFFTFLRKLGGALAVGAAGLFLDLAGLPEGLDAVAPESARTAVRWLASVGTTALVLLAAWLARGYPLTRARHSQVLIDLDARDAARARG